MVRNGKIRYTLDLQPGTHKKIKVAAALAGKTMKDFILEATYEEIERREDK